MKAGLVFFILYVAKIFITKIAQHSGKNTLQHSDIWSDSKSDRLISYV